MQWQKGPCKKQGSYARLLSHSSGCLGQTQGLAGNSKHYYEVCDSKREKPAHMYCIE